MKKSTRMALKVVKLTLIMSVLVLLLLPLTSQAAPLKRPSWRTEYYDNPSLSGQPQIVRWENDLNQDWGYGSPALEIPKDHFSARWTNTLTFEKGSYMFLLTVDDGARVWLDGNLIIDAWSIDHKEKLKAKVRIDKTGDHEIQVAYFEDTGLASIYLEWIQLGGENDIVGAWHGEYFNNRDLAGEPVVRRQDGAVSFNWSLNAPHHKLPRDNFSVRWTRSIYLEEGLYNFRIQHDDGMRIYVDDKIIYDSWQDQVVSYKTRQVPLKGGYRTFVVEYYDHVGNAVVHLSFDRDPGDYSNNEAGSGIIVDNRYGGFTWGGPTGNRFIGSGGFDDDFYWTRNTNTKWVNYGKWTPPIPEAGNYEILAYMPGNNATTSNAVYEIYHYGYVDKRALNQGTASNKFVSLGIYYFADSGDDEFVILHDSTGEGAGSTSIAFDALKFVKQK